MSHPFPLLSAVLDAQTDDVLDFLDSHVPSDFRHWESEELPLDVLDVLDVFERDLINNGDM